jgi:hypothetical protein
MFGCRIHDGKECGVGIHGGASAILEDNDVHSNTNAGVFVQQEGSEAVATGKLSPAEMGHDFLFLQNTSDPTIRFPAETSDVSLPVGRVTRILHAKDATQQFCRFFVFFCSYLIFIYIFFATYDCHQQYSTLETRAARLPQRPSHFRLPPFALILSQCCSKWPSQRFLALCLSRK